MTKNIKSRRKLLKNKKTLFKVLIILFLSITILVILSKLVSEHIRKALIPPSRPTKAQVEVNAPYNLDASVIFNNKENTHIFTDTIIPILDRAKKSVELAVYSFDSVVLRDKLYELNDRGVKVTLVFSGGKLKQHNIVFKDLPAGIILINLGNGDFNSSFMHHKYVIIDRGTPNELLLAGSWNWTFAQELYDPSFIIKTKDKYLIECFGKEFDRLKNSISGLRKLKNKAYKPWAYHIDYKNCFVDIWWSPGFKANSIKYKLLDLINSAEKNIKIMIWQMNDMDIARALLKKAKSGINVSMIVDDRALWEEYSVLPYLQSRIQKSSLTNFIIVDDVWSRVDFNHLIDPEVKQKNYNPYFHHHTLIVDSKIATCGTANWTAKGNFINDETTIITDNKLIVKSFLISFDYFYKRFYNKEINAYIKNRKLIINNTNTNAGNTIIVVAQKPNTVSTPFIAIKRPGIYPHYNFNIEKSFQNMYLSVFLIDKNGQVIANKRFWKIQL